MTDKPLAIAPATRTKLIRTKYVTFWSPLGIAAGPFTLYMDTDSFKENEFFHQLIMEARPDAPQLQRPIAEKVTLTKLNVFYYQVVESEVELDILVNVQS